MVKLRLKRCGRKQQAVYQIVAIDARSRREGRDLQKVGFYDPIKKQTYLDFSTIIPFIQKGAQPTETVSKLLYVKGLTFLAFWAQKARPTETVYDLLYRAKVVKDFEFKPTMNNKTFLYIKTKDNEIIIRFNNKVVI